MAAINPYKGLPSTVTMPRRWVSITPHASNYLEGTAGEHNVAVALYAASAGTVTYYDAETASSKTLVMVAGGILPGSYIRVTAWTGGAGELYAGFIGDAL